MSVCAVIRRRGFCKWYASELARGHGQLVLLLLATLGALGAVEALGDLRAAGAPAHRLWLMLASLAVAAAVGVWALRRYLFHLSRAEHLAHQAVCPGCQAYARWAVEGEPTAAGDDAADAAQAMTVCCRACGARWQIRG